MDCDVIKTIILPVFWETTLLDSSDKCHFTADLEENIAAFTHE